MNIIMHLIRIKYVYASVLLVGLLSLNAVMYLLRWTSFYGEVSHMSGDVRQNFAFNHIVVHIDLKGAPPKLEYLSELLGEFKMLGVTALLMEYEDMFPFNGELKVLRAPNAYSKKGLQQFLRTAKAYDIEIIPLVQTFGHMEYVLKHRFHPLREHHEYASAICPSQNASLVLIQSIIKQVVDFHNEIKPLKIFHIGCDEVYYMNYCAYCKKRKLSSWNIFVQHVITVSSYLREHDDNIRVLIWDDMMRNINPLKLENSNIQNYIEPVVWAYEDILNSVTHKTWYVYSRVFHKIWIASAFKGADGNTNIIPKLETRFSNHLLWMDFVTSYRIGGTNRFLNVVGIFLTGWSRYDHTQPLCEILPIGIPSLVLNLMLIKSYHKVNSTTSIGKISDDVVNNWLVYLHCPESVTNKSYYDKMEYNLKDLTTRITSCEFPLKDIYKMFIWINYLGEVLHISPNENFTVEKFTAVVGTMGKNAEDILIQFQTVESTILSTLLHYFDKFATIEILNQKMNPLKKNMKKLMKMKLEDWKYIGEVAVTSGTERI